MGEGVVEKKRKNQRHASGSLASCSSCRFLRRGPGGAINPPSIFLTTTCPPTHHKHTFPPPEADLWAVKG